MKIGKTSMSYKGQKMSIITTNIASKIVYKRAQAPTTEPQAIVDFILIRILGTGLEAANS